MTPHIDQPFYGKLYLVYDPRTKNLNNFNFNKNSTTYAFVLFKKW